MNIMNEAAFYRLHLDNCFRNISQQTTLFSFSLPTLTFVLDKESLDCSCTFTILIIGNQLQQQTCKHRKSCHSHQGTLHTPGIIRG